MNWIKKLKLVAFYGSITVLVACVVWWGYLEISNDLEQTRVAKDAIKPAIKRQQYDIDKGLYYLNVSKIAFDDKEYTIFRYDEGLFVIENKPVPLLGAKLPEHTE